MEIQYIRKLMTSHMIIEQKESLSTWEEKMISHASIPGMLFAESVCEDGNSNLWYNITGKQSLDVVLEGRELAYDLLSKLLMGIYEAAEALDGILLKSENMLLLPECIYTDYETKQIYFCYYPNNTMPVEEAFLQLMEYILTKLAHEDEKAVELAYGIYEQAAKKGWSLHQLKEDISLTYQAEETMEESEPEFHTFQEIKEGQNMLEEEKADKEKSGRGRTVLEKCRCWLQEILHRYLPGEIYLPFSKKARAKMSDEEENCFIFEPEKAETEAEAVSRPTVLLTQLTSPIEGILRYEGNGGCENLVVEGDEYLIGSDRMCAGFISSNTVSRKHAKISKVGDIYMIEDLNSSNGTYVGGEPLNYKTKVSLQKNEIVFFAEEKFRFI